MFTQPLAIKIDLGYFLSVWA